MKAPPPGPPLAEPSTFRLRKDNTDGCAGGGTEPGPPQLEAPLAAKSSMGTGDWGPLLLGAGDGGDDDDSDEERVVPCESVSAAATWVAAKSRGEAVVAACVEHSEVRVGGARHVTRTVHGSLPAGHEVRAATVTARFLQPA